MSTNRGDSTCDCGLTLVMWPEFRSRRREDLMTEDEYLAAIDYRHCSYRNNGGRGWSDCGETLFLKIICPLCRIELVGWYHQPQQAEDGIWELFDTAYWSTFRDEAGKEDLRNRRDPVEVLKEKP